jgi:hypothetical protein
MVRRALPVVIAVCLGAIPGCGGSDSSNATPAELNQARKEGAQQERQKQKLRDIQKQLKNLKRGQQGQTPPPSGSAPVTPTGSSSCGGDLSVSGPTTCGFAANVESDYRSQIGSGSGTVYSYSPAKNQTYAMNCTAGTPHVCTGGTDASVYFP